MNCFYEEFFTHEVIAYLLLHLGLIEHINDDDALVIKDRCVKTIIDKARVARLATVDTECKPHVIPVVCVFDNDCYFIPIDE